MRITYVGLTLLSVSLLGLTASRSESSDNSRPPVICIDPGHPSEVNSGKSLQNGTSEVHIAWLVGLRLRELIVNQGFRVVMTKASENQLVRNKDRALIANQARASLMVRLHCDASTAKGYAVYYPDRQGTKEGVTGPSVEIQKRSKAAAEAIVTAMSKALGGVLVNGGVRGDSKTRIGSKQGALTGSIFSKVPVVTIEMVVLTNKSDAAFIKAKSGQEQVARAIADGIVAYVSPHRR